MPVPVDTRSRRRILSIWSALSTPLILGVIALLFLPDRPAPVFATIVAWLLLLLLIEALAQRNLFRFLVTLLALGVLVVAILVAVGLVFFYGWRITVAVGLGLVALVLLLANLRELVRD
jgi:hypothetical protein